MQQNLVLVIRDILESGSSFSAWIRLFLFLVDRVIVSGGSGYGEFRLLQYVFTYLANSISYRSWDDIILKSSLLVSLLIIVG